MTKSIFPDPYEGSNLFSAKPRKQMHELDWNERRNLRKQAAQHPETELFPLSWYGEEVLKSLKERRPDYFKSVKEENLWRLFHYYEERFEIFEADCREFEEFFYDMDGGTELWKWTERLDGERNFLRMGAYDAITTLILSPLMEAKEQAKNMRKKLQTYFDALRGFTLMGMSLGEVQDEWERRHRPMK